MHIIITGTTRGLGKSLLQELKERKLKVLTINRSEKNKRTNYQVDFAKLEDMSGVLKWLSQKVEGSRSIVFINNASDINPIKKIGHMNMNEINESIFINLIYPIQIINALLNGKNRRLTVLNITSGAKNQLIDSWSMYSTSKLAITKFLSHLEVENSYVEFRDIDPGVMDTSMQRTIRHAQFKERREFEQYYEDGLLKRTTEVAKEIVERYIDEDCNFV